MNETTEVLVELVRAVHSMATALYRLGLPDASTSMGAIETLSLEVKEGSERIANGLNAIAEAISEKAV